MMIMVVRMIMDYGELGEMATIEVMVIAKIKGKVMMMMRGTKNYY